ncbi:MAG TPA: gamma-glutamylcyclotransferase family protein [Candidatus Anoxymicrobiaceae bacterium]
MAELKSGVAIMEKPDKCPECGLKRVATIIYGMPGAPDEAMQKRLDEGTVKFGGCDVEPGNPTWVCSDCGASDSRITRARYPYFAYGSNMDTVQMRHRCPDSVPVATAELFGYRFIINSRGVATIVQDDSSTVHGVLWRTTDDDETSLDRYEGVGSGLYSKQYLRVKSEDGEAVKALVYVAADRSEGDPRNGYMKKILEAAERMGLPETYVAELKKWVRGQ